MLLFLDAWNGMENPYPIHQVSISLRNTGKQFARCYLVQLFRHLEEKVILWTMSGDVSKDQGLRAGSINHPIMNYMKNLILNVLGILFLEAFIFFALACLFKS